MAMAVCAGIYHWMRSDQFVDLRDVGEAALFKEAVGRVVVFAGFKVDAAYPAPAKPAYSSLKQRIPGAVAAVVLFHQDVAYHPEWSVSILLYIGHGKTNGLSFFGSVFYSFAAAIGFGLALVIFSGIREKLAHANPPRCFRGVALALVTAGLLALAFMGFSGLVKEEDALKSFKIDQSPAAPVAEATT